MKSFDILPFVSAHILLLLAGTVATGCNSPETANSARAQEPTTEAPIFPVETVRVSREPVQREQSFAGVVVARRTFELAFPSGGIVRSVRVEAGQRVRRGQVLAQLDATPFQATLAQANEAFARSERDRARAAALQSEGIVPLVQAQDAETGQAVARANLSAARFAANNAALTSPIDGIVELRSIDPGEVVGAGMPLFRIASEAQGWSLRVAVPDRILPFVRVGEAVELSLDAFSTNPIKSARIQEIARTAHPVLGTYDIEIAIETASNLEESIRAGMVGRTTFSFGRIYNTSVPLSAIRNGQGLRAEVWVVENERIAAVPVEVGFIGNSLAAVAELPGHIVHVVTRASEEVRVGSHVRVTAAQGTGTGTGTGTGEHDAHR